MVDSENQRIKNISQQVFSLESRVDVDEAPPKLSCDQDLLLAVIVLGVISSVFLIIIIYGYCRFVRGRHEMADPTKNIHLSTSCSCVYSQGTPLGGGESTKAIETPNTELPVKMRKRSMTFTQTDEECRKYREDLADAFDSKPQVSDNIDRSRKKSTVTFVGVE